jgi:hypothetical protein
MIGDWNHLAFGRWGAYADRPKEEVMKSISKRFKLGGGFVLLVSLVALIPVGAQVCIQPPPGMTGW